MRLGVPFIAPRQQGAVGGQLGKLNLPSVGCAPDSPVHHRTVTVAVRCAIAFQIRHIRPLVHGVSWRTRHYSVCPTDRWRDHVSREDCAADRWRRRQLAHQTVRCTTGQSGEL
jgi:hypothetical protein